jgi:hypothetical protein
MPRRMTRALCWKTVPGPESGHFASARGLYRVGETVTAADPNRWPGHRASLFALTTVEAALHRAWQLGHRVFELSYDESDLQAIEVTAGGQQELRIARCRVEREVNVTPCTCAWCQR